MTRNVLLIGATGQFGRRLAGHLATFPEIELHLASRDAARAERLAGEVRRAARCAGVFPVCLDVKRNLASVLAERAPWLVIDGSGPFQGAKFATAQAAIGAGAHWIDLADARDYLALFPEALNAAALTRNVCAFAGASSTPALSTAAVAALTQGWRRIDTADIAIFPAGRSRVGRAVIETVLGYAGQPIAVYREGRLQTTLGWGSLRRRRLPHFGPRALAPVETADADLLPARFDIQSRVAFSAGLESVVERLGLMALARLRARGLLGPLLPLAGVLEKSRALIRLFASEDGGMTVDVTGLNHEGEQTFARWWLLAERGEGPHVPILAALALTRKLLAGYEATGARLAADALSLAEIEAEMRPLALTPSVSRITAGTASLFDAACSAGAMAGLPPSLRAFHANTGATVWQGRAAIETGRGIAARVMARLFGFPAAGADMPVTVTVDRRGREEIWTRNFAGRCFTSHLTLRRGQCIAERFGAISVLLEPLVSGTDLRLPVSGWECLGLSMPRFLAPNSQAREFEDAEGRFRFDVRITLPLVGLITHYRGWLAPHSPRGALAEASPNH